VAVRAPVVARTSPVAASLGSAIGSVRAKARAASSQTAVLKAKANRLTLTATIRAKLEVAHARSKLARVPRASRTWGEAREQGPRKRALFFSARRRVNAELA
jgi:hypothetical protein